MKSQENLMAIYGNSGQTKLSMKKKKYIYQKIYLEIKRKNHRKIL